MLADIPILSLITFSPLLGILILLFMPKQQGRWIKIIGIATTMIPLLLSAYLYVNFNHQTGDLQFKEQYNWLAVPLNFHDSAVLKNFTSFQFILQYSMGIDGLSLPLVFLTALVTAMAALASVHIKKRWKTFYILFLLLEIGMFGVFMARDLFLFFIFFELTLIPTFFLIGIWGYKEREKAANKFLIYNGIGSAVMLIAFLILVSTAGFSTPGVSATDTHLLFSGDIGAISHNLQDPTAYANLDASKVPNTPFYISHTLRWALFIMLLIAFGIKLPLFPFHTWMLKVHTEAPPSVVMIHSGILLKMGAYGLIRFGLLLFPEEAKQWAMVLAILGIINILYGAILAFVQDDLKLILAYSSISHMGIVLLGIAAFNQIGLEGAVFQMVSHGLISALMFLIVGSLYERTDTTMIGDLGGLAKNIPFISGILLVAGLASLGLPGLSGFISEFLAFLGLFASHPVVTAIGALGIILAAVYVLRGVLKITFGPPVLSYGGMKDARLIEAVPMITLVAFILLLGIYPSVLSQPLLNTINGFDQLLHQVATKVGG